MDESRIVILHATEVESMHEITDVQHPMRGFVASTRADIMDICEIDIFSHLYVWILGLRNAASQLIFLSECLRHEKVLSFFSKHSDG